MATVDSGHERRQFPRIRFKAYGFNYRDELFFGGQKHDVSLVDISPGGARLGSLAGKTFCSARVNDELSMRFHMDSRAILPESIACVVRWRDGDEIGVQFLSQLDVSVGELQKLLGP